MMLEDSPLFDVSKETNESSHTLFKTAFPDAFAWELLDLFSGNYCLSETVMQTSFDRIDLQLIRSTKSDVHLAPLGSLDRPVPRSATFGRTDGTCWHVHGWSRWQSQDCRPSSLLRSAPDVGENDGHRTGHLPFCRCSENRVNWINWMLQETSPENKSLRYQVHFINQNICASNISFLILEKF